LIQTTGLNHIHLAVRDVERAARFYEDAFGLKRLGAKRDGGVLFLQTPGASDLVTLSEGNSAQVGESGGIDHFGFGLGEPGNREVLEAAVSVIENAGGRLIEWDEIAPGIPTVFVADPDGYTIQL
jgi:catechol 2,3-dioxygenase-like lactoylglutathione lyase family enzyme